MRILAFVFLLAPAIVTAQTLADSLRSTRDSSAALEAVTVSAIRARDEAPISAATISKRQIERKYFGQDIPLLLQDTPSLTSYAETGNFWGYSYMRLRGIDQSRINLTLDGIPLNDPEDQVLYFADFPDLANSIHSIQVQRGVGTSAPGTASYGGSINFQSVPLLTAPSGGELQLQGGSFGTARVSGEYSTGLLGSGFAGYGRASALQSSGYRRHSGMTGRSAFVSLARFGERDMIKLIATAGLFTDTMAYIGATESELAQDRRANALRADEVDRFGEQVVGLTYTRVMGASSVAATAYRISASGGYDVCISDCDQPVAGLWNFNLDFRWYGATAVWTSAPGRVRTSLGINGNTYERDHHAYARPDLATPLYFNTGHKDDASVFGKIFVDAGPVVLFGDVQARHARFGYDPDANAGITAASRSWSFFNPKAGLTWAAAPAVEVYTSYGINSREPARSDMFAGFDNLDTTNVAFVGGLDRVRPERVGDLEAGVRWASEKLALAANLFDMRFRDEILPVGRLSYIGTPLRSNVRSSWRRGVEFDGSWQAAARVRFDVSATAMRARIANFTDDEAGVTYTSVAPLLTPAFTSAQRAFLVLTPTFSVDLRGRYTGKSQLTNTGDPALRLPDSYVADVSLHWDRGRYALSLHGNNVGNSRRFGGGHVAYGAARYYVLAPRGVFALAKLRF